MRRTAGVDFDASVKVSSTGTEESAGRLCQRVDALLSIKARLSQFRGATAEVERILPARRSVAVWFVVEAPSSPASSSGSSCREARPAGRCASPFNRR